MSPPLATVCRTAIAGCILAVLVGATSRAAAATDAQVQSAAKVVYVSSHTTEEPFRSYFAAFFQRLVAGSITDLPRVNGQPVDGSVLVVVTIAPSGATERVDVVESSSAVVESHAVSLIRKVQPFAPFNTQMKEKATKVVITSYLTYGRER